MTLTLPLHETPTRTAAQPCPNCEGPLLVHGDDHHHYWSCRSCNLVFLA